MAVTVYNVGPTSNTLGRRCTNVIQMFCNCLVGFVVSLIQHISYTRHRPHVYASTQSYSLTPNHLLKVIYHPLYGMNNYVLIWGDWLSCDPLRGSHDSQSPHIWGDWLSCDSLRGSHDSQSPNIRKHLCPILWQFWFICHKFIHTIYGVICHL